MFELTQEREFVGTKEQVGFMFQNQVRIYAFNPKTLHKFYFTKKSPYFEHLVGSLAQYFYDAIAIAKRIEQATRMGRTLEPTEKKGFYQEKEGF